MSVMPSLLGEVKNCFNDLHLQKDESKPFFSREQIDNLNKFYIPKHVAIIPDGNRRWAQKQESSTEHGHQQGADIIIDVVNAAKELGIKAITIYAFSTENWKRPQSEVDALMWLIETYLIEQRGRMLKEGIRLNTIGDLALLSSEMQQTIQDTKELTAECDNVDLILAINYGGRNEITRAIRRIAKDTASGVLSEEQIDERTVAKYLDTSPWGDPELLIRTSGQMRISNFLVWQISYSELYVVDVLWPDFRPKHLYDAIIDYQQRERRLGN